RIVQISDTHLSHRRAYAVPNVAAILDWIDADPPDLVIHTGDVSADDPDDGAERAFAHRFLCEPDRGVARVPGAARQPRRRRLQRGLVHARPPRSLPGDVGH